MIDTFEVTKKEEETLKRLFDRTPQEHWTESSVSIAHEAEVGQKYRE